MAYANLLRRLGDMTAAGVVTIFTAWKNGQIDKDEAVAAIATAVATANSTAYALGDASLAATLSLEAGEAISPLGLVPPDETSRLRQAATTLLDTPDVSDERIARLGRSEPLTKAANAYSEGMKQSRLVSGWTRGLSTNACQLCQWWARGGQEWPDSHAFPTHKGCTCTPQPVMIQRRFA